MVVEWSIDGVDAGLQGSLERGMHLKEVNDEGHGIGVGFMAGEHKEENVTLNGRWLEGWTRGSASSYEQFC